MLGLFHLQKQPMPLCDLVLTGRARASGTGTTTARGTAIRSLQLWNVTAIAVLFGELLDSTAVDLELVSDLPGIGVVVNNPLTDPGNITLVKLHFTWWLIGEIMPKKSLTDTTSLRLNPNIYKSRLAIIRVKPHDRL